MLRLATRVALLSRASLPHRADICASPAFLFSSLNTRLGSNLANDYLEHHRIVTGQAPQDYGRSAAGKALDEGAKVFAKDNHVGPSTKSHMVPSAKGFAAEHSHSTTYNIDAAQKGLETRCEVLKSHGRCSPDLVVAEKLGGQELQVQVKYGQPQYVKRSLGRPGYVGQEKLIPSDHPSQGRYSVMDGVTKIDAFGAQSSPISNDEATKLVKNTKKEFKKNIIKLKKLKKHDLQDLRSSKGGCVALVNENETIRGTGTFLDGCNSNVGVSANLSQTTSSSNKHEGYSAGLAGASSLSKSISGTGTPLDGANAHVSLTGSIGGRVETVNAKGCASSDKSIFAGVGLSAGLAKDVGSYTSSDGKTTASMGLSASVAAGVGVDSSQGSSTSLYAGVHVHGRASTRLTESTSAGIHGSAGISNHGYETSLGGHATEVTGNMLSTTTRTATATTSFTNGVPTNLSMSTSTSQNGLVCGTSSTSSISIALTSASTTKTTTSEGVFFDKTESTTKSLNLLGVDEKRASSVMPSQHMSSALAAGFAHGVQEIATNGLTSDGAKNVAIASGRSMVGSVANKAAQTVLKCPTSAGIFVGTGMSLASNAADLCGSSDIKRKQALKAVANDTSRSVCAGMAAKALAGRAPGAVGAAVQIAVAVPDIAEAIANGDTDKAAKVAVGTAVTASAAWAGAEAGAVIGACFGPAGAGVGGFLGGVFGSVAAGWFRS